LKFCSKDIAPKVTGMLIDLKQTTVENILKMLDNEALLKEKVEEAVNMIQKPNS
jgi:glutathionylspermidine synthase